MPKKLLTLEAINERLVPTGIRVEQRGNMLSLRATLPRKDGLQGNKQARISLGRRAIAPGLEYAEAKAWELAAQIAQDKFNWTNWSNAKDEPEILTCADWIGRYREQRLNEGITPQYWRTKFNEYYRRLPQQQELTSEILKQATLETPANTCTRKDACRVLQKLADFAKIDIDLKPYQGNYSRHKAKRRELPTDAEIVKTRKLFELSDRKSKALRWQYVYGLLAAYGLRPHEAFFCDVESTPPYKCRVREGKTGARDVLPLYPEWAEEWKLWKKNLPVTAAKTHTQFGQKTCAAIGRYINKKFPAYNLRHAYAIRASVRFGFPVKVVANWMGHDPGEHLRTYNKWISDADSIELYQQKIEGNNRPLPPI